MSAPTARCVKCKTVSGEYLFSVDGVEQYYCILCEGRWQSSTEVLSPLETFMEQTYGESLE